MKVFIFTKSYVDKDGDLDVQDIKAFANENDARAYYEHCCLSLEVAGYDECWHEEKDECAYIMQTYFENTSSRSSKIIVLAEQEV